MSENKRLVLSDVGNSTKVKLINVDAGDALKNRLAVMGLLPGAEFVVVSNGHPGSCVVKVKNSRMILGRGMAEKIIVEIKK